MLVIRSGVFLRFLILCSSILLVLGDRCKYNFTVHLSREITKNGFHRDLLTSLLIVPEHLSASSISTEYNILIEDTLPSGIYVDPSELKILRKSSLLESSVAVNVNVEEPEYRSKSITVYTFAHVKNSQVEVIMPIHLRYHLPQSFSVAGQYAVIYMLNPNLYIQQSGEENLCSETINYRCSLSSMNVCVWSKVPHQMNSPPLSVSVPTGNQEDAYFVIFVTSLVTIFGCTIVGLAIHSVPSSFKSD